MASMIRIALCAGALLTAAGCITPDGYDRDLGGGGSGQAGAGAGTAGVTGRGGAAAGTGSGGTPATGTGGVIATGGATGTLFADDFESGTGKWITDGPGTATTKTDGSTVYDLSCLMSDVYLAAAGDVSWTDVVVQGRIKILSFNGSSSSYYAGLCARVEDASDYYCVTLRSDGKVAIRGDIGGSSNSIGSSVSYGVATGTWYTVELEVVGSTITASINGTPVLPKSGDPAITDSSLAAGGIALIVDNAEAEFDDVSVTTP